MTDLEALQEYAARKDANAFRILVEQYQRLVYAAAARRLGRAQDIEDAVQLTFLKLARAAGTVQRDLAAWLHCTAVNTANDLIRRDQTRRRHEAVAAVPESVQDDRDKDEWQRLTLIMDEALLELDDVERRLLVEYFFQDGGRSQRQMAAEMNVSQPTVQRRIQGAVESLRAILRKRGCSVAVGLLALGLERLASAQVPATLTVELTKIGVAGAGGAEGGRGWRWRRFCRGKPIAVATGLAGAAAVVAISIHLWPREESAVPSQTGATSRRAPVVLVSSPAAGEPAVPTLLTGPQNGGAAVNRDAVLNRLASVYALADGQNLRKIPAPFPAERVAFANAAYPTRTYGTDLTFGFWWQNGKLQDTFMHYSDTNLTEVINIGLRIEWYHVDHLERIVWNPGKADWVVRDPLSIQERFDALAGIISSETGKQLRFEHKIVRRPCIVLSGSLRTAPQDSGRFNVLMVGLAPLPADVLANELATQQVPKDIWTAFQFQSVAERLDAPFFSADNMVMPSKFLMPREVRLHRNEPGYDRDLQLVLKNVQAQVGGTWKVEDRNIDMWEPMEGD